MQSSLSGWNDQKMDGKKRDTLRELVRGFGVEDFFLRAPASKSVTEQPCCCLVSCFLVPGRAREAYKAGEWRCGVSFVSFSTS
jgi:hypothetical protein